MKTSVILASWLVLATSSAWAQDEAADAPSETSDLPPPESLPSLEEMSRAESEDSAATDEEGTTASPTTEEPAKSEESPASEEAAKEEEAPAPATNEQPAGETPPEGKQAPAETMPESAEAAPPAPETNNETVAAPSETPEASSASSSNTSLRREPGIYGSDFGSFRVGLGAGRPTFDEKVVKYYDDLYGKPSIHPDLFLDYNLFDWYLTLGVGARFRYYRATGYAAQTSNPTGDTLSDAEIDRNSDVELVMIPVQGVVTAEITPWRTSFFTLNAWTGVERMFVQETRHPKEGGTSSFAAATTDDDSNETYVSKGWNTASVVGASVSLRLDYFDRASVNSLAIMGFRSVFLTPYMEIVKTQKAEMGKWDRRILGLLFTFESIH